MDFSLTEDQQMMQAEARTFCKKRVLPFVEEWDKECAIPAEVLAELGELGYMSLLIPEEYDGLGVDTVTYACVMEEFARASASLEIVISVHNSLVSQAIANFASEDLKKRILPILATGEKIGAYCLSEPGSGTDASGLIATAVRDGDEYLCNGTKSWVTNGGIAGIFLVFFKWYLRAASWLMPQGFARNLIRKTSDIIRAKKLTEPLTRNLENFQRNVVLRGFSTVTHSAVVQAVEQLLQVPIPAQHRRHGFHF